MKKTILSSVYFLSIATVYNHALSMDLVRSLSGRSKKQPSSLLEKTYNEALSAQTPLDLLFVVQNAKQNSITEKKLHNYISSQDKQTTKDLFLLVALHRIKKYNANIHVKELQCITTLQEHAVNCYELYRNYTDIRHTVNDTYGFSFTKSHQHKATTYPIDVPDKIAFHEFQQLDNHIQNMYNDLPLTTLQHWNFILTMILAKQKTYNTQSTSSDKVYENLSSHSESVSIEEITF